MYLTETSIQKILILEDYLQDLMDGMSNDEAIKHNGQKLEDFIQDERILDKTLPPEPNQSPELNPWLKPKYDEFNNKSLKIIRHYSNEFNVPYSEKTVNHAHKFIKAVGEIENSGKTIGQNPFSSAKGLYQFTNDGIKTAAKRYIRDLPDLARDTDTKPFLNDVFQNHDANRLPRIQQTNLALANFGGHGNGKYYFDDVLKGDHVGAVKSYDKIHHTAPDIKTIALRNKVFNKYGI